MPRFGQTSKENLSTCHEDLQRLFNEVIKHWDCSVTEGYRNEERQNKAYRGGKSKVKYPNGKHNRVPSDAVDVVPYISGKGIVWEERECLSFGGFVVGVSTQLGIRIRWGGDWDSDRDVNDQSFNDLVHFEIKKWQLKQNKNSGNIL